MEMVRSSPLSQSEDVSQSNGASVRTLALIDFDLSSQLIKQSPRFYLPALNSYLLYCILNLHSVELLEPVKGIYEIQFGMQHLTRYPGL